MNRFIPLLPPVPNLAAILVSRRSGLLQVRENTRRQFSLQIEQFFNDFLAGQIEEAERTAIWQRAAERIQQAFTRFNVEGVAVKTFQTQQDDFRQEVSDALRDLLLDGLSAVTSEQLVTALGQTVQQARDNWRKHIGEEEYRNFQRLLLLDAMDKEWREYLTAMDDLRREISLEAIGQRDPKVEYKRRSYQMFADMRQNIERDVVNRFFQQIAVHQEYMRQLQAAALRTQASQSGLQVVPRQSGRGVEIRRDIPKVGRNDPCPCGSGKKYKNCHMRQEQPTVGGRNGQPGKQPVASKGKR
ncbi:MAG: SEC-C metal-binding domain-containing protein [Chloroflexota bacterium]